MRPVEPERIDEAFKSRGLGLDVIGELRVAFIFPEARQVGGNDMIGAQMGRKPRPIILVASKAVDENERRLRGIAALQIGPGATIDLAAFLHQAGTPTQPPAADGAQPAGQCERSEAGQVGSESVTTRTYGVPT